MKIKRIMGSVLIGVGGLFGIGAMWTDANSPLTHSQGVAASVTTAVLLLAGGLIYE